MTEPQPNPICICTHHRSDHDTTKSNPPCEEGMWVTTAGQGFFDPCDCPGFEADPKANGDNECE